MKVFTSKPINQRLYSGLPKLIVAVGNLCEADVIVLGKSFELFYASYDSTGEEAVLITDSSDYEPKHLTELLTPPPNCWAIYDTGNSKIISLLKEWYLEIGVMQDVPNFISGNINDLYSAMLARLHSQLFRFSTHISDMYGQIAALRADNELLREKVAALHKSIDIPANAPLRVGYCAAIDPKNVMELTGAPLVQVLSGHTLGLTGIDIFIAEKPDGQSFILSAEIVDSVTESTIANWHIPAAKIESGYLSLWLKEAMIEEHHHTKLRLKLIGVGVLSLMLASRLPLADYCIEGSSPAKALAIRQWKGTPGVAYSGTVYSHIASKRDNFIEYLMPESWLQKAQALKPVEAAFTYFQKFPKRIMLHPVRWEVTSAVLPEILGQGVLSLGVKAYIDSKECKTPVNCRLLITEPGANLDEIINGSRVHGDSGWQVVEPVGAKFPILLECSPLESEKSSIVLLTQVTNNRPPSHARVMFDEFRIGVTLNRHIEE